ncbi:piggyBac transposable element-derived protein 3-like [Acyrthosiphon pisum]|uniref:PiggyBac transposable element-derived protein domain-containing protein n=1 Tax=Acyrthosiphon pisum TaxID=7029 RepID=A0A8R2B904_ACYPI|nr:piggyBac transposable element-derived protein 3-like [Acyrthosiphon pisum]|eukprot:XP_008187535.1 PREDICTED: piggyBac transposable element-derived protein 3-like [Acyrthosiphon pisum]
MFTNDIFEHLVSESNKYAMLSNNKDPNITVEELKCFISILIISGYNSLPGKRYYWEDGKDMKNEMVSNAMRHDRFLQISRFLHCADNMNINTSDKMFKLRPLIEKLKVNFLKNFQPYQYLSYDESMIKYYGRHGCKQFLRGKPIRFGYKAWCLTTDFGYLLNFDIYQGKSPNSNTVYEDEYRKAATPLMIMLDDLPEEKKNLSYSIYFDNLFTGFNLLVDLRGNK